MIEWVEMVISNWDVVSNVLVIMFMDFLVVVGYFVGIIIFFLGLFLVLILLYIVWVS